MITANPPNVFNASLSSGSKQAGDGDDKNNVGLNLYPHEGQVVMLVARLKIQSIFVFVIARFVILTRLHGTFYE